MTLLAPALAAAALWAGPATAGEDVWLLEQARAAILRLGSERWSGDVAEALAAARPVLATDPVVAELAPLLAEAAAREPRGPAPSPRNAPVPRPGWRLAWLDLDGAGQPEIVLAGGSSPAPYYAVFDRAGTAWRFLHDAPFRFLGAATHRGRLHLLSVFDGYGLDGPRLAVDTIDSTGRAKHLVFSLMEWPTGTNASGPVSGCTTTRTTALRATAVRDDHPADRGAETLAPGNARRRLYRVGASDRPRRGRRTMVALLLRRRGCRSAAPTDVATPGARVVRERARGLGAHARPDDAVNPDARFGDYENAGYRAEFYDEDAVCVLFSAATTTSSRSPAARARRHADAQGH